MTDRPRLLAFCGSLREGSLNRRLLDLAVRAAEQAGAELTRLELRELDLPLFDPELEARHGLPAGALRLKAALAVHDGFLIASPEHNGSVTAALKSALDWASRSAPGEGRYASLAGRVAGLLSASPGLLGGSRSLTHLRLICQEIEVVVLPEQVVVPRAQAAFTPEGELADGRTAAAVSRLASRLVEVSSKLRRAATPDRVTGSAAS